jgi:hypothetical protein
MGPGNIVDLAHIDPAEVAEGRRGAISLVSSKSIYHSVLTDGTALAFQRASRRTRHGRTR